MKLSELLEVLERWRVKCAVVSEDPDVLVGTNGAHGLEGRAIHSCSLAVTKDKRVDGKLFIVGASGVVNPPMVGGNT
jgi:hypothetical protein